MKTKIILQILLICFFANLTYSQWYLQYGGSSSFFNEVDFVSVDYGWVKGYSEISRTTDGGETWDTVFQIPQSNTHILSIDFVDVTNGWMLMWVDSIPGSAIYHTVNGGETWTLQYSIADFYRQIQFIDENKGWCIGSVFQPTILITTDGGNNWINEYVDPNNYPSLYFVNFIDENTGWVGGEALYKTTDGGFSWVCQITGLGDMMGIQFINSEIGWYTNVASLLKTTDGGYTWNEKFYHGTGGWNAAPFFFTDTLNGWIAFYDIIYHTSNGGEDWVWQSGISGFGAQDICFVDVNNGWIVGNGILHTTNGGLPVELISFTAEINEEDVVLQWTSATELNNSGFEIQRTSNNENVNWKSVGFVEGNGTTTEPHYYTFIDDNIVSGKYLYRLKQIDNDGTFEFSDVVEVELGIPGNFKLQQNYPNPFNPVTRINYSIPEKAFVSLRIYDLLGNEIEVLVNEEKHSGNYEVEFDGKNLASGVYIYTLKSDQYTVSKKLIILK